MELPAIYRSVYDARGFVKYLERYGARIEPSVRGLDGFTPLSDWWEESGDEQDPQVQRLRKTLAALAPTLRGEIEELRRWKAPENPTPKTPFGALYGNLVERYATMVGDITLHNPAGPFDERHPGMVVDWDAAKRRLTVRERDDDRFHARTLAIELRLADPTTPVGVEGALDASYADAWKIHALRTLIEAMSRRELAPIRALEEVLARPTWALVLDRIDRIGEVPAAESSSDWMFVVSTYRNGYCDVTPYQRKRKRDGSPARWIPRKFETIFAHGEQASALERDIARVAMCAIRRVSEPAAELRLGSPHAHELLRLLRQHPRVGVFDGYHATSSTRVVPEKTAPARIGAGDLTMKMDRAPNGTLTPRFFVEGIEVVPSWLEQVSEVTKLPFRGMVRGETLVSALVPEGLLPWLSASKAMEGGLAFPIEAVGRVAATTAELQREGIVELPREALGAELAHDPKLALRVEWHGNGTLRLHVLVSVCEGAPLVSAGRGATLFTFEKEGRRVFVERDLAIEKKIEEGAPAAMNLPLVWDFGVASTETIAETLAVAEWLDRNPLGCAIEVTLGERPTVVGFDRNHGILTVREEGHWLVLDGKIDAGETKLTLGDVLEAARHARRFVQAKDGLFVELSNEALDRLATLAVAVDLAGAKDLRIHDAFGPLLVEAGAVFRSVEGIDLAKYQERFRTRSTRLRVGSLEKGKLRPYQREGVAWMLRLASWAPGCVLADDMGLGKTVQTAAVLAARAAMGPQIIVAPASVTSNWLVELARFVPSLKVRWLNEERDLDLASLGAGDLVVVSYNLVARCEAELDACHWATAVIDEAQYAKNLGAQRTRAIRALHRDFTIALTGTPLENHLGELYSIVDIVFPSLLGSEPMFRERFRKPIEAALNEKRLAQLGRLLEPFLLRRTRGEVLEELPPRQDVTESIELSVQERRRYLALRKVCEDRFSKEEGVRRERTPKMLVELIAALTRLRQLACDPSLVDPTYTGPSTKIERIVELARELAQEGNKALVFSTFATFLDHARTALEAAGLRVAMLTGDVPVAQRRAIIEDFQSGAYDVFCVSLMAGGTGLNLTRASYVIHADPWWNPAAEEQATARAHRMGQTEPVTVIRLVARGTIEEAVLDMHGAKRELAEAVLSGKGNPKKVSTEDLLSLLRFGK